MIQDAKKSPEFQAADHSLRTALSRPELNVQEIPAPKEIAENSVAFATSVRQDSDHDHSPAGTGRFVLFWSPEPQENWSTRFRIVVYARAPYENDIGTDSGALDITWEWLTDALKFNNAEFSALAGTTTRIISTGHGELTAEKQHTEVELRASWSPHGTDMAPHFAAWQALVATMSGISAAPGSDRVSRLY